jgi:hypothetical protein
MQFLKISWDFLILGFSKILGFFQRFFWIFDEVYEDFQSNLPLDLHDIMSFYIELCVFLLYCIIFLLCFQAASLKHEAGGVLGEVRRKLQDCHKLQELTKSLAKLRELRKSEGEKKGLSKYRNRKQC